MVFRYLVPGRLFFFQGDGQPESLETWEKMVHQGLMFTLGVSHYCCIVGKKDVSDKGFTYFVPGSESGNIEQHAILSRTQVNLFS